MVLHQTCDDECPDCLKAKCVGGKCECKPDESQDTQVGKEMPAASCIPSPQTTSSAWCVVAAEVRP